MGLTTAVLTMATWPWFGLKGVVWFMPVWIVFETVYRVRMRALMACPQCGFDPYLYMTDVQRARKAIDLYWREKFREKGVPYPGDELQPVDLDAEEGNDAPQKPMPRVINAKQHSERSRNP